MKTTTKVAGIIGGVAAAALGAYFYAKTPIGKKQVGKIKTKATLWANGAKRDILNQVKKLKAVSQKDYHAVVEAVVKKYKTAKKLAPKEVALVSSELKKHWNNAKKEITKISKDVKNHIVG